MTYRSHTWAVGLVLTVSTLALASHATAQSIPLERGQTSNAASPSSPAQSRGPIGNRLDTVLVEGDPESIGQRQTPPPPARAFVTGPQITSISRGEWVDRGWSEELFNRAEGSSRQLCATTSYYSVRMAHVLARYEAVQPQIAPLRERYASLEGRIRVASRSRTGANVFSTVLGFLASPITGGIVGLGAAGNEMQGRAWDYSMETTRQAGALSLELTDIHVEFSVTSALIYQDYLGMVGGWCTERYGRN